MDHCSKFIIIHNQSSLGAGEYLVGKHGFESLFHAFGFSILTYHGDNDISASNTFKDDCNAKGQNITFSGSGVHYQNGVAESSIQTVVSWAKTKLLHAAIHCPEVEDLQLWPLFLQHLVYVWNVLPNPETKLSFEICFSNTCSRLLTSLQQLCVWGCANIFRFATRLLLCL